MASIGARIEQLQAEIEETLQKSIHDERETMSEHGDKTEGAGAEAPLRRSDRSRMPSAVASQSLEIAMETYFQKELQKCKETCDIAEQDLKGICSEFNVQQTIGQLQLCEKRLLKSFQRLRNDVPGGIPTTVVNLVDVYVKDIQTLIQFARTKLMQLPDGSREPSPDRMSNRSHVSRASQSLGSQASRCSSTSSKKAQLMAHSLALQSERLSKKNQAKKQEELKRLNMEEMTRREQHKVQLALQRGKQEAEEIQRRAQAEADRLQQEMKEKLRQAQVDAELDKRKQELEDERLNDEIQQAQTELKVLDDLMLNQPSTEPYINLPQPTITSQSTPHFRQDTSNLDLGTLAKTFAESVNLSRLPIPEPTIFSGDSLKYPSWKASFTALIESRGIPAIERIHYLKKYLSGPAKEAVEGTFYFETEDAYDKAKEILEERYGDSFRVAEAFRDKLDKWPKIAGRDSTGLRKFADFLKQCQMAMSMTPGLEVLNDCRENRKMLVKLPDWIVQRWSRKVADHTGVFPTFAEFVRFLSKEADIACNPITSLNAIRAIPGSDSTKKPKKKSEGLANTFASQSSAPNQQEFRNKPCLFCQKLNHRLHDCRSFMKRKPYERKEFIQKNGLCFGCLAHGHLSKTCTKKSTCKNCNGKHPTCLHGDYQALNKSDATNPRKSDEQESHVETGVSLRSTSKFSDSQSTMIVPVYLSSSDNPETEVLIYALLDTQSDTTFILDETSQKLNLISKDARLRLSTITSDSVVECQKFNNLQVRGYNSDVLISLPSTYTSNFIPVHRSHIPTSDTARKWPHLSRLENEILPLQDCEVGLLIGYNCPQALAPKDVILGNTGQPFAQKSDLGWSIIGMTSSEEVDVLGITHRIVAEVPDPLKINLPGNDDLNEVHYICKAQLKEEMCLPQICRILESDFSEKHRDVVMSQDDIKCMEILKEGIHLNEDGYYEMPLPFKQRHPKLPNNEGLARKRLFQLKKRLQIDEKYFNDYKNFIDDIIQHGEAEEVAASQVNTAYSWYIPHHGVYHPKKPGKIRVVFDCSARYNGVSLNDYLLSGPDLNNSLIGVLCRFRQENVAFMGDIERMFHQFKVNIEHRDYL